ncbi:MAG TPA: Hsp20/alpha crystallin family protein [Vicinamibacterales bacterium]|nr:Hsp20/alpha crystallin family protein [Vicinamibacterales bacterium]
MKNYDPRFDRPGPAYQTGSYTVAAGPYFGMPLGFGYAGVPFVIKLISDIAQARMRAAATVANSVAESMVGLSGVSAQQWNAAAQSAYAASAAYQPPQYQQTTYYQPAGQPVYQPAVAQVRVEPRPVMARPATVAVVEGDENYHAHIELPAYDAEEMSLVIDRDVLEVRSRARDDSRFDRVATVQLPDDIDRDNITAEFRDGVLNVRLPKEAKGARRELKVKVTTSAKTAPTTGTNR